MFLRRKKLIDYQADCIALLESEKTALKESIETQKKLIETQEKSIFNLTRENRVLTAKIDNMTLRNEGSVVLYG